MLRRNGYVVLDAPGAAKALSLAAEHDFALLLTDVVMPDVSGRALAEELCTNYPGSRVLYMSGYSEGVLEPAGELDSEFQLIHKPFNEKDLLVAVAAAMNGMPADDTA
jgi:DNA-binding NtrC family response regulator